MMVILCKYLVAWPVLLAGTWGSTSSSSTTPNPVGQRAKGKGRGRFTKGTGNCQCFFLLGLEVVTFYKMVV